jgi:hypothetical protein
MKANAPYILYFSADPVSSVKVDHDQPSPGSAQTAGQTSVHFRGRGAVTWQSQTGRPRADGLVPFWFSAVNVYFRLTDCGISITSNDEAGSCSFRAAMRRKINAHFVNPTRTTRGYRDQILAALEAMPLPTEQAPRWLHPDQAAPTEARYVREVGAVIQAFRSRISVALRQSEKASDSPASYERVYREFPAEEWNRP